MFMSGIEKNGFDKGYVSGIAKARKEMFHNVVLSLMEKGLTKEEATQQALKLLRLKEIPE